MTKFVVPKGVWWNGCTFLKVDGKAFPPWGALGHQYMPHKHLFPKTREEAL